MLALLTTGVVGTVDTMGVLLQSVSTLGFPIVMCFIIMKYMKEKDQINREELKELSKAIENNTLVISKLMERIGDKING